MKDADTVQQSHSRIAKRLLRAKGHLEHVIEMLEDGRPCLELAQQLQAVEKAIGSAKKALIHDHLQHCLQEPEGGRGKAQAKALVAEFSAIAKYL